MSRIKQIFGNHDMTRRYLEYLLNPDVSMPPFRPVLYRAIAIGGINDEEAIAKNDRSYHEAKNKQVMRQLIQGTNQGFFYDNGGVRGSDPRN